VTALLEPFSGYLPTADFAHRVVGPPRSMLTRSQDDAAKLDPLSFRHSIGRNSGSSFEGAVEWLRMAQELDAIRPLGPTVFVYRIAKGDLVATGILAEVSIAAYDSGLVKRHEMTIADLELNHARYIRTTRVHGNPVALGHRPHAAISDAIASQVVREPDCSFIAADGFSHALWAIEGQAAHDLCESYNGELYIADGHHRMAAASLVASEEERVDSRLPAALFASSELRLRSFARCVVDPDLDSDAVLDRLKSEHRLEEVSSLEARPRGRFDFGVKIGGRSFRLHIAQSMVPDDVYRSLDVNLLQDLILEPVFAISDPSQDERLSFIADMSEHHSEAGDCTAWFLPFPVPVSAVFEVADMGRVMPPKSTWFGPKIPAGIVVRLLDNG
jgi:uncharacterized protein (DUF1015 family)